jgi:hypothetical protein
LACGTPKSGPEEGPGDSWPPNGVARRVTGVGPGPRGYGHVDATVPIPKEAVEHHRVDWSKVPSLVSLYAGRTLIGSVRKANVEHPPIEAAPFVRPQNLPSGADACPMELPISPLAVPVHNASTEVIGHIEPGAGFVRSGAVPPCVS